MADGLPLFGGAQLAIESALTLNSQEKRGRVRLVVLGAEVGGRWSQGTVDFLSSLAWAKVRDLPQELQEDARRAWFRRWCMLVAAAKAFAMFGFHSLFQKKKENRKEFTLMQEQKSVGERYRSDLFQNVADQSRQIFTSEFNVPGLIS